MRTSCQKFRERRWDAPERGRIGDMGDLPRQDRARRRAVAAGPDRKAALNGFQDISRPPVMRNKMDQRTIEPKYSARFSAR